MSDKPLHPEQAKEEVSPSVAEGLTSDPDELEEKFPVGPDGSDVLREIQTVRYVEGTRIPVASFVAKDDDDTAWLAGDDRVQRGAVISYPQKVVDAIRDGYICIRCQEPQVEGAFPLHCSLCGFEMRELQASVFAAEFEGEVHYGPSLAIQAAVEAHMIEQEKAAHERKLAEGGSPMKGLRHASQD